MYIFLLLPHSSKELNPVATRLLPAACCLTASSAVCKSLFASQLRSASQAFQVVVVIVVVGEGAFRWLLFNDLTSIRLSLQRLSRSRHRGTVRRKKLSSAAANPAVIPSFFCHKRCTKKKSVQIGTLSERSSQTFTFERR